MRLPRRRTDEGFDRRLLAPMILGAVLNPVNSSMIAVSLVPIGAAFGAPPSQTAWLVSALYLATATGQPVVGRLVDAYGPRRLYLAVSISPVRRWPGSPGSSAPSPPPSASWSPPGSCWGSARARAIRPRCTSSAARPGAPAATGRAGC